MIPDRHCNLLVVHLLWLFQLKPIPLQTSLPTVKWRPCILHKKLQPTWEVLQKLCCASEYRPNNVGPGAAGTRLFCLLIMLPFFIILHFLFASSCTSYKSLEITFTIKLHGICFQECSTMFSSEDDYLKIMEEKSTTMGACILCLSPLSTMEKLRWTHFVDHLQSTIAFNGESNGIHCTNNTKCVSFWYIKSPKNIKHTWLHILKYCDVLYQCTFPFERDSAHCQ